MRVVTVATYHCRLRIHHFRFQVVLIGDVFKSVDAQIRRRVVDDTLFVNSRLYKCITDRRYVFCTLIAVDPRFIIGWSHDVVHLDSEEFALLRIILAQDVVEKLVNVRVSALRLLLCIK